MDVWLAHLVVYAGPGPVVSLTRHSWPSTTSVNSVPKEALIRKCMEKAVQFQLEEEDYMECHQHEAIYEGLMTMLMPWFPAVALDPQHCLKMGAMPMVTREIYWVMAKAMNCFSMTSRNGRERPLKEGGKYWPGVGCAGSFLMISPAGFHGVAVPPTEPHHHRGEPCLLETTPLVSYRSSSRAIADVQFQNIDEEPLLTWEEYLAKSG